jgi:hypothetical protein
MNKLELLEHIKTLQAKAATDQDYTELNKVYATREYKNLSYMERNHGLVTSHKLQDFIRCQWCYAQKYINGVQDPTEDESSKEALTIGLALDDRLTEGEKLYKEKYEVVARRCKESAKIQLTQRMGEQVDLMTSEFKASPLFNQNPIKKIVLAKYGTLIMKIELDDFIQDKNLIIDVKSTANILTFNPQFYAFQMGFYAYVMELALDLKCHAMLEVVDKGIISRSGAWWFDHAILREQRGPIVDALENLQQSQDTGIFMPAQEQEVLWGCPYYGLKTNQFPLGHGRQVSPKIV